MSAKKDSVRLGIRPVLVASYKKSHMIKFILRRTIDGRSLRNDSEKKQRQQAGKISSDFHLIRKKKL